MEELEKEGFLFDKINVESNEIRKIWQEYHTGINRFSKKNGWEENVIYTPTFINPQSKKVLAFAKGAPSREDLIMLANSR